MAPATSAEQDAAHEKMPSILKMRSLQQDDATVVDSLKTREQIARGLTLLSRRRCPAGGAVSVLSSVVVDDKGRILMSLTAPDSTLCLHPRHGRPWPRYGPCRRPPTI
jgi:hypothetical protein